MKRVFLPSAGVAVAAALFLFVGAALAAGYTLFGAAHIVSPGNASPHAVEMQSTTSQPYGGVDFQVPAGTTFGSLNQLSTDYMLTSGSCGGGSPRFQINVMTPSNGVQNIFAYIGPPPSYTACPPNVWTNSGNLLAPANLIDATQVGGAFYEPVAAAQASYGSYPVVGIQIVTDAGWSQVAGSQIVRADNVNINGTIYTFDQPASQNECKNGGWQTLTDNHGNHFKNQGDCVSYVATGGRNAAAGGS